MLKKVVDHKMQLQVEKSCDINILDFIVSKYHTVLLTVISEWRKQAVNWIWFRKERQVYSSQCAVSWRAISEVLWNYGLLW